MDDVVLVGSVTVQVAAFPRGDIIFLPSDANGTLGQLNSFVLQQLGLPLSLPDSSALAKGFEFSQFKDELICFIVTVGPMPTDYSLRVNLQNALMSPQALQAKRIWLPLMGTGAGRLALDRSFMIIMDVLQESGWLSQDERRVVISRPEKISRSASSALSTAITNRRKILADADQTGSEPALDGYAIAKTPAVEGVLLLAAQLARYPSSSRRISSSLIFFALAESQGPAAPDTLLRDASAELFVMALRELGGSRYEQGWRAYFDSAEHPGSPIGAVKLPRPTANLTEILASALVFAKSEGLPIVDVGHLIVALLNRKEMRLHEVLSNIGITSDALLREYSDAKLGQISKRFQNDVASDVDRLGYNVYAQAISEFLTHVDTPPPLSISIQAPWGCGKSSLMNLVREKLDPRTDREKYKPKIGLNEKIIRLKVGNLLGFLDRKVSFDVVADASPAKMWTIWFNAWKYETTEQIWAGLVDSIVSQISERLPAIEREKFLIRLNLSRIDDGIVRKKIYDRILFIWWAKIRSWVLAGGAACFSLLGLGASAHRLPPEIVRVLSLGSTNPYAVSFTVPIILSVYAAAEYLIKKAGVHNEPASFSLSEYIRVPDYTKGVGEIHNIHADLRRVLAVIPKVNSEESAPIAVFIDDLDRCSPGKIASVVEGVSMLLASDTYRCIFIIGMDPQMVASALEKAHEDVRKYLPRYERTVPLGWRFMDKFIQLPFTIPPTGSDRFGEYIDWLSDAKTNPIRVPKVSLEQTPNSEAYTSIVAAPIGSKENLATNSDVLEDHEKVSLAIQDSSAFVETRDVGAIVREITKGTVGNPREMKRMINIARFYLAMRTARRSQDSLWRSPSPQQYSRWIIVTLRWPDMMRWLQWGADEVHWDNTSRDKTLVVRRLGCLEEIGQKATDLEEWKASLGDKLAVPIDSDSDWACDPKLFEFFNAEGNRPLVERLSAAAMREFW